MKLVEIQLESSLKLIGIRCIQSSGEMETTLDYSASFGLEAVEQLRVSRTSRRGHFEFGWIKLKLDKL